MKVKEKEWREYAKDIYSRYGQNFDATLVQNDEKFFIADWRDRNGSGNMAARFILDKDKGTLIITGDSGNCVACWYGHQEPEDVASYLHDVHYFISKIQCTDHKYTYEWEDVQTDINEIREEMLGYIREEGGIYGEPDITEESCNEDFDEMLGILENMNLVEGTSYPSDFEEIMCKYNTDWWESAHYGQRVSTRLYCWMYAFQECVRRLLVEDGKEVPVNDPFCS